MKAAYEVIKSLYYFYRVLFRQPYYLLRKNRISLTCRIKPGAFFHKCLIGRYCYIGARCVLSNVQMGNYCSLAPGVQIGGMEHSWWWGSTSTRLSNKNIYDVKVFIEDDVWIGANAVIRKGVRVGRGAVIGACSLVLTDAPPYSIMIGIPARISRKRFPDSVIEQIEKTEFWRYPPKAAKQLLARIDYPNQINSELFRMKRKME